MPLSFNAEDLLGYTDWQREQWRARLDGHGPAALAVSVGPHGDGRWDTVGTLIRHIFSAELRYVERIAGEQLTDPGTVPADAVAPLFDFGRTTRLRLRGMIGSLPAAAWDQPIELVFGQNRVPVTPRKIVLHVLTHEIRHWAQVGTLLRQVGMTGGFQDLLFSPVLRP